MVALPAYAAEDEGWNIAGRCRWRRDSDEFAFVWPDEGVGLGFENFRENRDGDLTCEISAQALPDGHIHWAKFNITSTTSRNSVAKFLGEARTANWRACLEQACTITGREYRRGEPFVDIAHHQPGERPRDLITRFIPYGQPTILYARGGSGKSFVAMGVCAAVIAGAPLANGVTPTETGRVLYLDYEADADEQYQRLRATLKGMGLAGIPDHAFTYRRQQRPIAEDARRIAVEIARHDIKLVVIDSLVPALDGPAIEDGPIVRLMNGVRTWGAGVTVIIIAHVNKGDATTSDKGPKSIYGNMFSENLVRSTWEIRKSSDVATDDGLAVAAYHRKTNRSFKPPVGLRIRMEGGDPDWPDVIRFEGWSVTGDDSLNGGENLGTRIINALRKHGKPMTSEELADVLDTKANTVRTTAGRLTRMVVNINPVGGRGNPAQWALRIVGNDEPPD